jgi:spermidine synthase
MARAAKTSPTPAPATMSESDGVRYLHLGTPWVQGAMRVRAPQALELEYVQRMMAWMLLRPSAELTRGHAVQLGLGAASITRYCHGVMRMRTTAVELNRP